MAGTTLNPEKLAEKFYKECQGLLKTPEAAHRESRAKYFQPLSYITALGAVYDRMQPGSPAFAVQPSVLMRKEIAHYRQRLLELKDQVWYFYAWGYFLRSIEKTLLNDRLALVRFLQGVGICEHYSYHLACYRLLCTYPGLILVPSVETLLKSRSESLVARVAEALEKAPDMGALLRSLVAFRRVFPYAKTAAPAGALRPAAGIRPGAASAPAWAGSAAVEAGAAGTAGAAAMTASGPGGAAAHSQKRPRIQPSEASAFRAFATRAAASGAAAAAGGASAAGGALAAGAAAPAGGAAAAPSFKFV